MCGGEISKESFNGLFAQSFIFELLVIPVTKTVSMMKMRTGFSRFAVYL